MDTLVQFLRARLDEDEQTARAAGGTWWAPPDLPGQVHDSGGVNIEAKLPSFAAHIARHDPARVLAEVTAKRTAIGLYEMAVEHRQDVAARAYRDVLRLFSVAYSDHPDFTKDWAPDPA